MSKEELKFEERFERKCEARGLKCHFGLGIIYINTGVGNWRIMHDKGRIYKVLHENYRGTQFTTGKFKSGYHEQKLWNYKVNNILDYITKHDQLFAKKKNNNVENSIFRISKERFKVV